MRWLAAPLSLAVAALGVSAVSTGHAHPDDVVGGGTQAALALQLAAGLVSWLAGLYVGLRWRAGWAGGLLATAGVSVLLTAQTIPAVGSAPLFTVGLLGRGLVPALAGAAALLYLNRDRTLVAVGLGAVLMLHSLLPTLLFDPQDNGCFACPRNLLGVAGTLPMHHAVETWGLRAQLVVGVVLAVVALLRWAQVDRILRVATALVVVPGAVAATLGSLDAAHALAEGVGAIDSAQRTLWLAQCACALTMGLGVAVRVALARRLRDRVAGMVVSVLVDADHLRDGLAATLGDPEIALAFPRDGRAVADAAGRESVAVTRGERLVAQVFHGPALSALPDRVSSAVQAAGLALEHAGEESRLRAELDELSELRTRIVAAGDAERRRLERNLHDGAQQRLIALAIAIRSAHARTPDAGLTTAADEVTVALGELRAIAHGIHPVTLTDAGLAHAIHQLVEDAGVPVRIDSLPAGRVDTAAEAAAYRMIADVVACAELAEPASVVVVRVTQHPHELSVEVEVAGGERALYIAALATASDRARAIGGAVHVREGLLIELRTPCVS